LVLSAGKDFAACRDHVCTRFHKVGAGFGDTASCKLRLTAMFLPGGTSRLAANLGAWGLVTSGPGLVGRRRGVRLAAMILLGKEDPL